MYSVWYWYCIGMYVYNNSQHQKTQTTDLEHPWSSPAVPQSPQDRYAYRDVMTDALWRPASVLFFGGSPQSREVNAEVPGGCSSVNEEVDFRAWTVQCKKHLLFGMEFRMVSSSEDRTSCSHIY